jgi:hypothetical protein
MYAAESSLASRFSQRPAHVLQGWCSWNAWLAECDGFRVLQAATHEHAAFMREVDAAVSVQRSTEGTVVKRFHAWVGKAFTSWVHKEPAALTRHIQVLRDAAKLDAFLWDILHKHGITAQVLSSLFCIFANRRCSGFATSTSVLHAAATGTCVVGRDTTHCFQ